MSRTGSSPGRPSRPTTRRRGRTPPSTSRAAARAGRRSPGTPTRRPGSATPTCAGCCFRRTGRRGRGSGGFVRSTWDEVTELIAAAHVHTIKAHGPDRVVGFSPIPAMSQVSYAAGTRFLSLIGATILSFYDWYADLPVASPQVFGDQTDVPESADWWNAAYLIMWGSNLPVTRTPDAHFMTEARYRGQKVVAVSPDYAVNAKFADEWIAPRPGTDGALAMAMGHVILAEFFRDRQVPRFTGYVTTYTDLPFLVTLRERAPGAGTGAAEPEYLPERFLTAAD